MICSQMAIMAAVDHQNIAMALGVWGMFLSTAVAIGSTIATTVWTNGLPFILKKALPADSKDLISDLIGSLEKQMQYPLESPIRDALVAAYGISQEHLLCTAMYIRVLAFVYIFI